MNPSTETQMHMATLTASLETSLRNCSLNDAASSPNSAARRRRFIPDSSSTTTLVELNSHISLPYHWEQCLDLKTGEIYYVNWRSGKKAKEDPRRVKATAGGYNYSDEDEHEEEDDDDDVEGSYDSEGSSVAGYSSSASSMESYRAAWKRYGRDPDDVLVVAGCKGCLMYHMVPKHVEECPKCSGHLLHFDTSEVSP